MSKVIWIVVAGLAACSCGSSSDTPAKGGRGGKGGPGGPLAYPVDVAKLVVRSMTYTVNAPGSIDAYQQVQITARVSGAVDKVLFSEGQDVKEGDVLASIESERYSIAVAQAQSVLTKTIATQHSAQAALDRRLEAQKESPGLVPGEEIEQKQTAVDTAKADVDAARQALRVAQLNLRDSSVRAPIAGIVQTRTVQQGQYLQPGAVLATILQREPLLVRFQVSEQDAPRFKPNDKAILTLKESPREFAATIKLVGGAADPSTRLVPVTGTVDPTDHEYWLRPGAFCQVSVPIGNARQAIVVPSLAVAPTEKGNVVYVVDDKNIVHATVVELGMHTADGGVELTRGVTAGQLLVVRGIDPLTDGAPVNVNSTMSLEDASKPPPDAGVSAPPVRTEGDQAPAPDSGSGSGSASAGSGSGKHRRAQP